MALLDLPDAGKLKGTSALYQVVKDQSTYEYVSFSNVLTNSIEVKPMMDSMKADQIGTSVEIKFTAIASHFVSDTSTLRTGTNITGNPEFGTLVDPDDIRYKMGSATATNTGNLERMLRVLAQNRGRFVYKIGDSVLYDVVPKMTHAGANDYGWDGTNQIGIAVNQTPTIFATVEKIIGDSSAYVSVNVKFDYIRCTGELGRKYTERYRKNVKSLRWYYADDIDANSWLTRRVYHGRLELYDRNINVHLLRALVLPPLQLGFKRVNINLQESDDGMSMDFEITDQEMYAIPPHPISNWSGSTTMSFPKFLVGKAEVTSNLSVTAPRGVPRFALVTNAMRIIDSKIHWFNSTSYGFSVFTDNFSITDQYDRNQVDASVKLSFIIPSDSTASNKSGVIMSLDAVYNNDLTYNSDRHVTLGSHILAARYDEGLGPGHDGGIKNYNPQYTPQWYPSPHTLFGIVYCALQHPCSEVLQKPFWLLEVPPPGNDKPGGTNPYKPEGGSGGSGYESPSYGGMALSLESDGQDDTVSPYTQYEIETVMSTNMGIKTFSPMNNIKTLTGENATRIIHQSNAPTETVTMVLDAKRLNKWPNGPNELSFKDSKTGIYYICESVDTIASTAIQDALRTTVQYSLKAVVRYQLSKHHKYDEDRLVFTPPFITEASESDPNLKNSLRGYYQSAYNKSGFKFRPGGDEDNGATEPPPTDGGGGDTPIV